MFKRNIVPRFMLSLFALAALCMFAAVISAQKTLKTVTGPPLQGIEVKVVSNTGGGGQVLKTDMNGKVDLSGLSQGSYWLEIVESTKVKQAVGSNDVGEDRTVGASGEAYRYITVTISGPRVKGGTTTRSLNINDWKFVNAQNRATTHRMAFELGPVTAGDPEPAEGAIVKSKSNISNN